MADSGTATLAPLPLGTLGYPVPTGRRGRDAEPTSGASSSTEILATGRTAAQTPCTLEGQATALFEIQGGTMEELRSP